jgi:hypothetical protein
VIPLKRDQQLLKARIGRAVMSQCRSVGEIVHNG